MRRDRHPWGDNGEMRPFRFPTPAPAINRWFDALAWTLSGYVRMLRRSFALARPAAEDEAEPGTAVLEDLDDRGYHAWKELYNGCRAWVCRTPFGARIVAGRIIDELPQYAWDFETVQEAEKALVHAFFSVHMDRGVVVSPGTDREPSGYIRRWRYTEGGQMERF